MTKDEIAVVLAEVGTLLELQGENPFRCKAYTNAARIISQFDGNLAEMVTNNRLGELRGIGSTLRDAIQELVATGRLTFHEELRAAFPPGLFDMLRVPGLGVKKVNALWKELGIDSLPALKQACEVGRVAGLRGFGAKTQSKILEGIAYIDTVGQRVRFDQAYPLGLTLLEQVRRMPGVIRAELCGSLRRRRETAKDIDLVASSDDPVPIMAAFVALPQVRQVLAHGPTKSSVVVQHHRDSERIVLNADLRVVTDEQFPYAVHYLTGSKEHATAMRARALARGWKLNEYRLTGAPDRLVCRSEADLFAALDLDEIPPELREDTGEIAAAETHTLPRLIELADLRGAFHNHTTYSDGRGSLKEMAQAAQALGWEYLGIGDHSQSLKVANGMTPARVRQQQHAIDQLNAQFNGFRLLKGVECDILADGSLDYDEDTLATFDYVVASVHTHFSMSQTEMTQRIIRAIRHPRVTMLGHATGRLLLRREGYKVDLDAVLDAAAEAGTMIEINAQPDRLDLDWQHCKRVALLGIPLVINPDAHGPEELALVEYGIHVARRGWLTKANVFNTRSLPEVVSELQRRRERCG